MLYSILKMISDLFWGLIFAIGVFVLYGVVGQGLKTLIG